MKVQPQPVGRVIGEGGLTDEDIAALQPTANEAQEEFKDYKHEKTKTILDIKERISRRRNTIFTLEIDIGDEDPLPLKVRRMNERERAKYNKINYARFGNLEELTSEQVEEITMQGYEIMSKLIVDPNWTVDEWMDNTDPALLQKISGKVALLSTEVNDAVIVEEFSKK
jgi:hypothetical protein